MPSRTRKAATRQSEFVVTPDHRIVRKDWSAHGLWLIVHKETPGGAYLVSNDIYAEPIFIPKSLLDVGDVGGGFERMDRNLQRELFTLRWCEGPGFLFDEKGLR